ncbi:F-box/LRR-repeat protein 5-like [Centruroides sculpturatus]|uniref:F-box/LRR-repeat protein 5-like n=1 Tax=Centruroides sculpturatus TaxID=218467 RepID=UPI000C6E2F04|nr:F-box/LRR-repeat protein 5-like [Centruroides sculpturatus]
MAPYYPEEVDVFTEPHSRMKQLVEDYSEKLSCTDFSDGKALESLLHSLHHAFREFKCHEYIENKLIMRKLKGRLMSLSVQDATVCNCHSDNRLSDILDLVQDGYSCSVKTVAECINYGIKLQHAVEEFTDLFLPHMREEEEVFQPMLIKYFEYEELKILKEQVIKEHVKWQLSNEQEKCSEEEETDSKNELAEEVDQNTFLRLPPEVIVNIFSFLPIPDLLRCSEVCQKWSQFVYDPSLWRNIYPIHWARGKWNITEFDLIEPYLPLTNNYHLKNYKFLDEDADYDESGDNDSDCNVDCGSDDCSCADEIKSIKRENKVLNSLVKYLLPKVGIGVHKIVLTSSRGLTSSLLHSFLLLCPNLSFLDVSYTNITDSAFKGLIKTNACLNLKHLDLSGCCELGDLGLYRLSECFYSAEIYSSENAIGDICVKGSSSVRKGDKKNIKISKTACIQQKCLQTDILEDIVLCELEMLSRQCPFFSAGLCCQSIACDSLNTYKQRSVYSRTKNLEEVYRKRTFPTKSNSCESVQIATGLRFLSLSGCYQITDNGLRYFAESGILTHLQHLDVSGCWNLSGPGLKAVVSLSSNLQPENLYYCDHIQNGPYAESANGCQNLESEVRACCCGQQR